MWPIHLLTIDMVVTNCFYSIVYDDNICGNKVTSIFAFFFGAYSSFSSIYSIDAGIRFEIEPFIAMFDARKFTFLFVFSWQLAIKLNSITDFANKVIQKNYIRADSLTHLILIKTNYYVKYLYYRWNIFLY